MPVTTPSPYVPKQCKPSLATQEPNKKTGTGVYAGSGLVIPSMSSTSQRRKRPLELPTISYQQPSCETDSSEDDIPAFSTSKTASKTSGPASVYFVPERASPEIRLEPMTGCGLPQYNSTQRPPSFTPQVNSTSQGPLRCHANPADNLARPALPVHAGGGQPPPVPTVSPVNECPMQLPGQQSPTRGTPTPVQRTPRNTTGNREQPIDLTSDSPNKRRRSQKSTHLYGMEQLMEKWKEELSNEERGQKQRKQRFEAERKEIKASDARISKLEEKIENLAKTYEDVKGDERKALRYLANLCK